ncbi:hypothetical protein MCEMSE6_01816 [Oxalobacteraceae bacterium]
MNTLEQLAEFYKTDKQASEHNYVKFYENYLSQYRNSQINLVEIGILEHPDKVTRPFGAASLRLWADYFPNAAIHGIDISDLKHLQEDRIKIYVGDQNKPEELKKIFEENNLRPNIIIDDGSHFHKHQQTSFVTLFDYLVSDGLYIIEDIAHFELVNNEVTPGNFFPNENTPQLVFSSSISSHPICNNLTLSVLMRYCVTKKIESFFIPIDLGESVEQNIEFCNIHRSNMFDKYIAFIKKKGN